MTVADCARRLRARRVADTQHLLALAAAAPDPCARRALLREVAALNADDVLAVVSALYQQHHPDGPDESALLMQALDAYVDAVLALDPAPDMDLLPRVLPTLRAVVVRFNRDRAALPTPPRIGGPAPLG